MCLPSPRVWLFYKNLLYDGVCLALPPWFNGRLCFSYIIVVWYVKTSNVYACHDIVFKVSSMSSDVATVMSNWSLPQWRRHWQAFRSGKIFFPIPLLESFLMIATIFLMKLRPSNTIQSQINDEKREWFAFLVASRNGLSSVHYRHHLH